MRYVAAALGLAIVVQLAAATPLEVEAPEQEKSEQINAIENSPELKRLILKSNSYTRGRSFFQTMGEEIMNFFGFGGDEYSDDYGPDYFYPSFDSSLFGGSGSSYSFYNPYGNYHPARDDTFEEENYGWGDFMFDAAMVAVPMALVMAAMPTGLFTIPIVGRSINDVDDLRPFEMTALKAVENADFLSFTTRDCQERIFCEVTQIGRNKESSILQKMFYLAAHLTPDSYAKSYGVDKLLKAARDGHCEIYKCVPLMTPFKKQVPSLPIHEFDAGNQ